MDSDQALVERVLAGDRRAVSELVARHEVLVRRLVARMAPDVRDQQELCQDIFVRAHARLAGFRFESRLSTWVASIAYRTCLNHLQSRRLEIPFSDQAAEADGDDDPVERIPDGTLSQLDALEAAEARRFVREQVLALPPHFRAAVTLFHLEEMDLADIAVILGLPEGTVKSHLFRARRLLKDRLARHYLGRSGS